MFAANSRASSAKLRSSHICKVRSKSSGHLSWLLIKSFGCGVGTAILLFALAAQIFAHTALSLELVKPATCASVAVGAVLSGLVLANGIAQKRLLCGVSVGVFYALCLSLTTALSGKPLVFDHVNLALLAALLFGGTAGGVTAATAIAALQEASGKGSRDSTRSSYVAYAQIVELCIELIRQFYEMPRQFRLLGAMGTEEFVSYDRSGLQPRVMDDGVNVSYRVPEFDLEIGAERESPYRTAEANQLALQLFQMGFFREDLADQALRCLELMDFKNKDQLARIISGGRTQAAEMAAMRQQLLQLAQVVDEAKGTHLAKRLAAEQADGGSAAPGTSRDAAARGAMERSRQQSREVVRPR